VKWLVVLLAVASSSGCAFEACCMRPATGLYDVCFAAAAPPPSVAEERTPASEMPAPPHIPGTLPR
jgi:hypothetical protein